MDDRYAECNDSEIEKTLAVYTGNWKDEYRLVYVNSHYATDFIDYSDGLANSFKTFQNEKLSNYQDKLKVDEWCYDDTLPVTSYKWYSGDNSVNTIYNYHGAAARILINKNPLLKCTETKLSNCVDSTKMYVVTLTADEVSLVGTGAFTSVTGNNNYLKNSYAENNSLSWVALSLTWYSNFTYNAFSVDNYGLTYFEFFKDEYNYSRPVLTIKSNISATTIEDTVTYGAPGTINNPYVIN